MRKSILKMLRFFARDCIYSIFCLFCRRIPPNRSILKPWHQDQAWHWCWVNATQLWNSLNWLVQRSRWPPGECASSIGGASLVQILSTMGSTVSQHDGLSLVYVFVLEDLSRKGWLPAQENSSTLLYFFSASCERKHLSYWLGSFEAFLFLLIKSRIYSLL